MWIVLESTKYDKLTEVLESLIWNVISPIAFGMCNN